MTNEPTTPTPETMSPEERARIRRAMADQAVKLAVGNRWEDAANLNADYVRLFPDDPEGFNRLGKALAELGRITDARVAYQRALDLDPANTIAKRNIDRLAAMQDAEGQAQFQAKLDRGLFIEETGKAAAALVQAVEKAQVDRLDAGDPVELRVEGNAVNVHLPTGEYVGMVEPRIGLRLARLMNGGNRYSAAMISATGDVRVMIRETYQDKSQAGKVSFPHARVSDVRSYTRRGLLRSREEEEYIEDDEDADDAESWSEEDAADAAGMRVPVDTGDDEDSYD